jgi:hypothetical protein
VEYTTGCRLAGGSDICTRQNATECGFYDAGNARGSLLKNKVDQGRPFLPGIDNLRFPFNAHQAGGYVNGVLQIAQLID